MVAPSPDWFVGVSGLPLLDDRWARWLRSHEVNLYPWDAGTEDGSEFSLNNARDQSAGGHHQHPRDGQVLDGADREH